MNQMAVELNNSIQSEAPEVAGMLSALGKEMFMPRGIISQSAQAKKEAYKYNATIGIATENGEPMYLDCIYKNLNHFKPADIFPYSPTKGKEQLRRLWQEKMLRDNPSLSGKATSLPIVVNALTHGLSVAADLFCDNGDYVILPDKFWANYRLTFSTRRGGMISTFPLFDENGSFNVDGMLDKIKEAGRLNPKVIVIMNFPNNPTGYTPTESEAYRIVGGLRELADSGIKIVVVIDDAYFGMFFKDSIKESLFSRLIGLSRNLLPIKLDAITKESFAWGFRVGFITFGSPKIDNPAPVFAALEEKVEGSIRGMISSSSSLSQQAALAALQSPDYEREKAANVDILRKRFEKAEKALQKEEYKEYFAPYPFNSGYFLALKIFGVEAEALRVHLLEKYGVGTVSTGSFDLRVAFSSIDEEYLEDLFDIIYKGCVDLKK